MIFNPFVTDQRAIEVKKQKTALPAGFIHWETN